jgi:dTDP-4-dehydrorhamnose 3,5-epimerase-like enzyme
MEPTKYSAKTFSDERGWLKKLEPTGTEQANKMPGSFDDFYMSLSNLHVFRGFHFQRHPDLQCKLIRVITGSITSYIVNLDLESAHYKTLYQFTLDADESAAVVCPPMHGNGFLAMVNNTTIAVLASGAFSPSREIVISPLDLPGLDLPQDCILSKKDSGGLRISEYERLVLSA